VHRHAGIFRDARGEGAAKRGRLSRPRGRQRDARNIGPGGGYGTMSYAKLTRDEIAKRIALDIPEGSYVNLGIGMPTLVGNHLPKGPRDFSAQRERHSRHGPGNPRRARRTRTSSNAGKRARDPADRRGVLPHYPIRSPMSAARHLDIAVLGAFQVSVSGDLAQLALRWRPRSLPWVARMDLAVVAKSVWVMMEVRPAGQQGHGLFSGVDEVRVLPRPARVPGPCRECRSRCAEKSRGPSAGGCRRASACRCRG